jgi:rhodanese-related sulfurtransferase
MPSDGMFERSVGNSDMPTIGHAEMTEAVKSKSCCIVDVREPHEFAAGHIAGAINLPLSRFAPQDLPKGRPVILVCRSGGRSAKALQQALSAGCKDVRHYPAGTGGWRSCGGLLAT